MTVAELKQFEDQTVVLHLTDGEIATAEVVFVDTEYEDIIVHIVTTNRPLTYKDPSNAAYAIPVADIQRAVISSELG